MRAATATSARHAQPFIIWTLQRTGGTNLAQRLFEASRLPGTDGVALTTGLFVDRVSDQWKLHEPFNYGEEARPFGFASQAWVERKDQALLDDATDTVCRLHIPVKHCVEMVPAEVSLSLARASIRHGYRHVFLYRRQPLNRLLSMEFARRSGVWGPTLKGRAAPDDVIFAESLPVARLTEHEAQCSARLAAVWSTLTAAGCQPVPVAFEDIYQCADNAKVRARLAHLLTQLGMASEPAADEKFIDDIVASGEQGTRDRYAGFSGIDALKTALSGIALFNADDGAQSLRAVATGERPAWVLHDAVDTLPALCWPDERTAFGGVLVLTPDAPKGLRLQIAGQGAAARWDIASPWMAKKFPQAGNASHARFWFRSVLAPASAMTLQLLDGEFAYDLYQLVSGKPSA